MTTEYPFPEERSLATRLIIAGFFVGVLGLLTFPLWRTWLPWADDEPPRETSVSPVTYDEALARVGDGLALSELSPTSRLIAEQFQAYADSLAFNGDLSSVWNAPDDVPPGVVVDYLTFCQNDVTILCVSLPPQAESVTDCIERPTSEKVVVQSTDDDWWAVVIVCVWSPSEGELQEFADRVTDGVADTVDIDAPPDHAADLDPVAGSYAASSPGPVASAAAITEARAAAIAVTGANRSAVTQSRGRAIADIDADDFVGSFTRAQQIELASAARLSFGSSVTVVGGDVVVTHVWTWSMPD